MTTLISCITVAAYAATGMVSAIDHSADTVQFRTATGLVYEFSGAEDYDLGDLISAIMSDEGTPDDVTDDRVMSARYAGRVSDFVYQPQQFTLSDCVLLARIVGGDTTVGCTDGLRTDINCDGKTDAVDLVQALEYVCVGGAAYDIAMQDEPLWYPIYDCFQLECWEQQDGSLEFEVVISVSHGDGTGTRVNYDPWYNRFVYDDPEMPEGIVVSFICYDLGHDGEIFAQIDYLVS